MLEAKIKTSTYPTNLVCLKAQYAPQKSITSVRIKYSPFSLAPISLIGFDVNGSIFDDLNHRWKKIS